MAELQSTTQRLAQQAQSDRAKLESSIMEQGIVNTPQFTNVNEGKSLAGTNLLMQSLRAPEQRQAAAQQQLRLDEQQAYNRLTAQQAVDYKAGQDTLSNARANREQDRLAENARINNQGLLLNQKKTGMEVASLEETAAQAKLRKAAQLQGNELMLNTRNQTLAAEEELFKQGKALGVNLLESGEIDVSVPEKDLKAALTAQGITAPDSEEAQKVQASLENDIFKRGETLMANAYQAYQANAVSDQEFDDMASKLVTPNGAYTDADVSSLKSSRKNFWNERAQLPENIQTNVDLQIKNKTAEDQLKIGTLTKQLDLLTTQGDALSTEIGRVYGMSDDQLSKELNSVIKTSLTDAGESTGGGNLEEVKTIINNLKVTDPVTGKKRNLNPLEKIAFANKAVVDGESFWGLWDADYNDEDGVAKEVTNNGYSFNRNTGSKDKQTTAQGIFDGMSSDIGRYMNNLEQTEGLKKDILTAQQAISDTESKTLAAAKLQYSRGLVNSKK